MLNRLKASVYTQIYTQMFMAVFFFILAKIGKKPRYPSKDEWINNLSYI